MVDESIDALFEADLDDSLSMDDLFSQALETVQECKSKVDRMRGAGVSTFAPELLAEKKARALVAQGEGSCEVRVHRGRTHQSPSLTSCSLAILELTPALYACFLLSILIRM